MAIETMMMTTKTTKMREERIEECVSVNFASSSTLDWSHRQSVTEMMTTTMTTETTDNIGHNIQIIAHTMSEGIEDSVSMNLVSSSPLY